MADKGRPTSKWTHRDSALWHTCEIAVELVAGRPPQPLQEIAAPFPPRFHVEERYWAAGPFQLLDYAAAGDGSYYHDDSWFFAWGPGAIVATLAHAAGKAIGNSYRQRAAETAATPRWTVIEQGTVYVTGYGFYMHTSSRLFSWCWSGISVASMVEPGAMQMQGDTDDGRTISWILRSDWAELVFITWAFARHPRHMQLVDGSWLPPGWMAWCASQRYPTRLTTPMLDP